MEFLASDVEKITGVKRTRLQAWMEKGYIRPEIQTADGHGTRNIWSLSDIYSIAIFKKITESGVSRDLAGKYIKKGYIQSTYKVAEIRKTLFILYFREGESVEGILIQYDACEKCGEPKKGESIMQCEHNSPLINILKFARKVGLPNFDDVYILNFYKIWKEINARIKAFYLD